MTIIGNEQPGSVIGFFNEALLLDKFIENVAEKFDSKLVYGGHRTDFSVVLWRTKPPNRFSTNLFWTG